jgi:hypothetical protein
MAEHRASTGRAPSTVGILVLAAGILAIAAGVLILALT